MVTLKRQNDDLIVEVQGIHRLLALKGSVTVPVSAITEAKKGEVSLSAFGKGLRLPGTHVPHVITAGSFYRGGEWHFWDVTNPEKTIEIYASDGRYRRIFVDVEDPEEALGFIDALRRTQSA